MIYMQVFQFPSSGPMTQQLGVLRDIQSGCAYFKPVLKVKVTSCVLEVSPLGMIGGVPVGMQMPGHALKFLKIFEV